MQKEAWVFVRSGSSVIANKCVSGLLSCPEQPVAPCKLKLLQKEKPDVLVVGEVHEWETAEYIRDAQAMGSPMSLIVLGHAESEEPGMEWLVPWLQPRVGEIKVKHIASHNPFQEA